MPRATGDAGSDPLDSTSPWTSGRSARRPASPLPDAAVPGRRRRSRLSRRRRRARRAVLLRARRARRRPRLRGGRGANGARRPCSSSGRCDVALPQVRVRRRARGDGAAGRRASSARRARELAGRRASRARTARRRPRSWSRRSSTRPAAAPGCSAPCERASAGATSPSALTTPEAIDLQRAFRRMLDAGDRACAIEASSIAIAQRPARRHALRGGRLHEPHPGPPRLPRHHGGLLRRQGRRSSTGRCPRRSTPTTPGARRLRAELRFAVDDARADVRAEAVELGARRDRAARAHAARARCDVRTPLRGRFNVDNVLCAIALALLVDVPDERDRGAAWRAVRRRPGASSPSRRASPSP